MWLRILIMFAGYVGWFYISYPTDTKHLPIQRLELVPLDKRGISILTTQPHMDEMNTQRSLTIQTDRQTIQREVWHPVLAFDKDNQMWHLILVLDNDMQNYSQYNNFHERSMVIWNVMKKQYYLSNTVHARNMCKK